MRRKDLTLGQEVWVDQWTGGEDNWARVESLEAWEERRWGYGNSEVEMPDGSKSTRFQPSYGGKGNGVLVKIRQSGRTSSGKTEKYTVVQLRGITGDYAEKRKAADDAVKARKAYEEERNQGIKERRDLESIARDKALKMAETLGFSDSEDVIVTQWRDTYVGEKYASIRVSAKFISALYGEVQSLRNALADVEEGQS